MQGLIQLFSTRPESRQAISGQIRGNTYMTDINRNQGSVNYAQRQAQSIHWLVTLNNISEQVTQIGYEVASARREIAATLAEYPAPAGLPELPEAVEVKIPREGLFLRKLNALRVIGARSAGGCK